MLCISTLDRGSSLTHTRVPFEGTYAEAVAECHRQHLEHGQPVYVMQGMHWLHNAIGGIARDRNKGSGFPEIERLVPKS